MRSRDKTIASMTTIPDRVWALNEVLSRVVPQVDEFYLTVHKDLVFSVKPIVEYYGINLLISKRTDDARKFAPLANITEDAYFFSLDDDLVYPSDYIARTMEYLDTWKKEIISCVHGGWIIDLPCESYYKNKDTVHFSQGINGAYYVMFPGTGTMAFHTSTFDLTMHEHLPRKNIADVQVGLAADKQKVPILTIPRPEKWLKQQPKLNPRKGSIWANRVQDDKEETELINSYAKDYGFNFPDHL